MAKPKTFWISLRAALAPAVGLSIVAFFGGYALFGANGVLAWGDYSKRLVERQAYLVRVESRRTELANRVTLLDPRHADPDLVDELARRELGVADQRELVVPLKQ